jgi:hypothetical protein
MGGMTMSTFVPPGFERCPDCGEYNGRTAARHLSWELPPDPFEDMSREVEDWLREKKSEIAQTMDPGQVISVTCLCHGPLCRRCGVTRMHKPGSNSYEPETNTIGHWPGICGMMPCEACREEMERKAGRGH